MGILYNRFDPNRPLGYTVNITINEHITHTGGSLVQTGLSGPMTPVTISPEETYRIIQPSGSSGITVTADGNSYVISGTPTANVIINCDTTQNPDILSDSQKDIATWQRVTPTSINKGYLHTVSSNNSISWNIPWAMATDQKNEGYYTSITYNGIKPNKTYRLNVRYYSVVPDTTARVRIVICLNSTVGYINYTSQCWITAEGTGGAIVDYGVNFTGKSGGYSYYLAITNSDWNVYQLAQSGYIRVYDISLREV